MSAGHGGRIAGQTIINKTDMERNLAEILEGAIVNYTITSSDYMDIDRDCRDSLSSCSGYVGVVRDGVFFDLSDQGETGRVESYYDVEQYLDLDLSLDEYEECSQWCFGIGSLKDLDSLAEKIADRVSGRSRGSRVLMYEDGCRCCMSIERVYVDIWKDGELIYSEKF